MLCASPILASSLKADALGFSVALANCYQTTKRHIREQQFEPNYYEILTSHISTPRCEMQSCVMFEPRRMYSNQHALHG